MVFVPDNHSAKIQTLLLTIITIVKIGSSCLKTIKRNQNDSQSSCDANFIRNAFGLHVYCMCYGGFSDSFWIYFH